MKLLTDTRATYAWLEFCFTQYTCLAQRALTIVGPFAAQISPISLERGLRLATQLCEQTFPGGRKWIQRSIIGSEGARVVPSVSGTERSIDKAWIVRLSRTTHPNPTTKLVDHVRQRCARSSMAERSDADGAPHLMCTTSRCAVVVRSDEAVLHVPRL